MQDSCLYSKTKTSYISNSIFYNNHPFINTDGKSSLINIEEADSIEISSINLTDFTALGISITDSTNITINSITINSNKIIIISFILDIK